MSEAKLQTARKLIDEGHYATARFILQKIDDPEARQLLAELPEDDPEDLRFTALEGDFAADDEDE